MNKVLTIAGSDSGGCAGIQADIKTISSLGVFAMSVVTAVTSQNTLGVSYIEPMSAKSVRTQIDAVMNDMGADAVKSGMLFSKDIIDTVAGRIKYHNIKKYILDPVMVATSGAKLLNENAIESLVNNLIPLSFLITPNKFEAEELSGIKINNRSDAEKACRKIYEMGSENILIKGGHIEGDKASDILYSGHEFIEYSADRCNTINLHGTGCTYSSAIASYLAKGFILDEAIRNAKQYITEAIKAGASLDIGAKGAGPVHHFYKFFGCVI